jgi:DMSO reductase anchor subunit
MTRTDAMPVKYHKDKQGNYKPVIDQKEGVAKHWNFSRLNSRENPLVLFTLFAQAALGAFSITFIGALLGIDSFTSFFESDMFLPLTIIALLMTSFALIMSVTHLGKPMRFYRGFNNLRYSPMAREGFGLAMFSAGCGLTALFSLPSNTWLVDFASQNIGLDLAGIAEVLPLSALVTTFGVFALIAGSVGLFYMNKCYQIKARPFWNHLQTATAFVGNSLSLGALVSSVIVLSTLAAMNLAINEAMFAFASVFTAGLVIEALGLVKHNHDLNRSDNEGGAAHYVQCTTFGKTYLLRNWLVSINIVAAFALLTMQYSGFGSETLLLPWIALGLLNCFTAVIGRALFYILVIPTTMPGAFFWKNKSFEEHARDTGLANNPATGVAPLAH